MSSTAPVELNFLGLLRRTAAAEDDNRRTNAATSSIRGMRTSAIAGIGTQQLRRVMAAAAERPAPEPTTMTLFYNGAVATFDDVPQYKAQAIMRMAAEIVTSQKQRGDDAFAVRNLAKDMPLTRKRSLQQFLQKRKERLARAGPYQLDGPSYSVSRRKQLSWPDAGDHSVVSYSY